MMATGKRKSPHISTHCLSPLGRSILCVSVEWNTAEVVYMPPDYGVGYSVVPWPGTAIPIPVSRFLSKLPSPVDLSRDTVVDLGSCTS